MTTADTPTRIYLCHNRNGHPRFEEVGPDDIGAEAWVKEGAGVRVKALEWRELVTLGEKEAITPVGVYRLDEPYWMGPDGEWRKGGIRAAQDDYEARIRATLELTTEPDLTDPTTVHLNMLRGKIAKPTIEQIIHLYGEDTLSDALAEVEYARKVAQMREDFPNGI